MCAHLLPSLHEKHVKAKEELSIYKVFLLALYNY